MSDFDRRISTSIRLNMSGFNAKEIRVEQTAANAERAMKRDCRRARSGEREGRLRGLRLRHVPGKLLPRSAMHWMF